MIEKLILVLEWYATQGNGARAEEMLDSLTNGDDENRLRTLMAAAAEVVERIEDGRSPVDACDTLSEILQEMAE